MAATPPSGTHLEHHNTLVTDLHAQLGRFGLTPTSGGPFTAGDPYHIAEHGKMLTDLVTLASTAGQSYSPPLPAAPTLGDTGHIADHLAIRAAIDQAANWPAWNDATGGQDVYTVNNYNGTGEKWRVHEFLSSGTLTVNVAAQPFRVLVVGGGGGTVVGINNAQGGGGAGGMIDNPSVTGTVGANTITVGAGGNQANGGNSSALGLTAIGGGRGGPAGNIGSSGGSGGGAGSPALTGGAGTAGQGNNGGNCQDAGVGAGGGGGGAGSAGGTATYNTGGNGGSGKASTITGGSVTYAGGGGGGHNGAGGGGQGGSGGGGRWSQNGTNGLGGGAGGFAGGAALTTGGSGIVIVAYRIG